MRTGAGLMRTLQSVSGSTSRASTCIASWRRKYYPDGVYAVKRHFYDDPNQAPPVCDRCCCDCCCEPGCESAQHKPGASADCLWWYGN